MSHQELIRKLNEIYQDIIPTRQPRFRYFQARLPDGKKDKRYAFCWTTQRDSKGKFYALTYRIIKTVAKKNNNNQKDIVLDLVEDAVIPLAYAI